MGDTIIFRGAKLRHVDLRQDKDGGSPYCRLYLSSDFSDNVAAEMGWENIPAEVMSAKLEGELNASHFVLTPGDKQLAKRHELQLNISDVKDFQLARIQSSDGKSTVTELRFCVKTADPNAAALSHGYLSQIGKHLGQLKISYAKQDSLDLNGTAANGDGEAQEPLSEHLKGAALASHREMAQATRKRAQKDAKKAAANDSDDDEVPE